MKQMILILVGLALGAAVAWGTHAPERILPGDTTEDDSVACTADAMLCPDGSAVGREGPDCTFAACPAEPVPADVQAEIDARSDAVVLDTPPAGSYVASPLHLSGTARGTWLNEGDFPVILTDWDGRIIAEHYVRTEEDWMTEDMVRFSGTLEFTSPYEAGLTASERGWLILQKDNPSGLPEHDASVSIPVWFAE